MLTRFPEADQASRRSPKAARQKFAAKKVRKDDLQTRIPIELWSFWPRAKFDYPTALRRFNPAVSSRIAAEQGAHEGAYQMAANTGASLLNETLTQATAEAKKAAGDTRSRNGWPAGPG